MYGEEENTVAETTLTQLAKRSAPLEEVMTEQSVLLNTLEKSLSGLSDRLNPVLSLANDTDGPELADRERIGSSSMVARIMDNNRQMQKAINIVQSLTRNLEV